jgi:hypothetical protein
VEDDAKAAAFEDEAGAEADFAFHGTGAVFLRAIREVRVFHGLAGLKFMAASLAGVVVGGHVRGVLGERKAGGSRGRSMRDGKGAAKGFMG